jgi:dimethylamine/trimethylamine dehydrogenase
MARDSKYDILFQPVRIGPQIMRNRFYKAPHCSTFGVERPASHAHFRGVGAEGGWAVVNTEYCSIHPSSESYPFTEARLWDDDDVRRLSLVCDKVHEHGSLVGVELLYGGAHMTNFESRMPAGGPSQIVSDLYPLASCFELDASDIREIQRFYVAAARRALAAGFDIVNIYGGHRHAVTQQFLEPFFNKRTDNYGGSFENRARFWRETIEQVKAAVGDTCAIAVRICMDSLRGDAGITIDDSCRFIELLDSIVDLWDLQLGDEWGEDSLASRFGPQNYERSWIELIRPHSQKPLAGVGRLTDPDIMVDMIASGTIDIIGSARGSIADPFLPRKIEEGRLDDIRECIGCNVCIARFNQMAPIICTQNATIGEEYRRGWHPERFDRAANAANDVLIVGAGPAGMECAVVLGKRGMRRVHLVEADNDIGGSIRWIKRLPGLGEWGRIVDYRRSQLDKLSNVEVITHTNLGSTDIRGYGADIVVNATGASWASDGLNWVTHEAIEGADASLPHCFTPEQVMGGVKDVAGQNVIIYDCDGYFVAVSIAERLAREGKRVTFITPFPQIAPHTFLTLEGSRINQMLRTLGVNLHPNCVMMRVGEEGVVGRDIYAAEQTIEWETDGVVLVTQRLSNDSVYRHLKAEMLKSDGIAAVFRIGDCVVPRLIADAIFDGHRLAREIDSDDPAVPKPFLREMRPVVPRVGYGGQPMGLGLA